MKLGIVLVVVAALSVSMAVGAPASKTDAPATQPAEIVKVAAGNNAFALDLYAKLTAKEKGNVFFSPFSIESALAMTYAGARGETEKQMAKVLHFDLDQAGLHDGFGKLVARLNAEETKDKPRNYQLAVANSLWGQKGYPFKKEFLDVGATKYGAGLFDVDFKSEPDKARQVINKWVEGKTNAKIKDLLTEPDVKDDTRLILVNAIHFKADWYNKFMPGATSEGDFKLDKDKSEKVPMMHQTEYHPFLRTDDFRLLELRYKGNEVSMVIIAPEKVDGLADVEKQMTADKLAEWIGKAKAQKVQVTLPKFKTTLRLELAKTLQDMGMTDAFVFGKADFTGIEPERELFIGNVIHKAFISVDETGSEAAAATAVTMKAGSAARPAEPEKFTADRPFMFLIRDNVSGAILFLGRITNPKTE